MSDSDPLASESLKRHRGKATWGDRLVDLEPFRAAAAAQGETGTAQQRQQAAKRFLRRREGQAFPGNQVLLEDHTVEGPWSKVVVFGGIYNNHSALETLLETVRDMQVEAIYCLGDLGGFGPSPEKVPPLLESGGVLGIQGNYEQSLAANAEDCNCGYTDPRDNHYAKISYAYTAERCDPELRSWLGSLPAHRRVLIGEQEWLLVHGSPREVNEFLFASASPDSFLDLLCRQYRCHGFLCSHSGLPWQRTLASGRQVVNVGALGRPANDGDPRVRFAVLERDIRPKNQPRDQRSDHPKNQPSELKAGAPTTSTPKTTVTIHKLAYDQHQLAREMEQENLPQPFIDTILGGWWTTCLEILPAKERALGKY